MMHDYFSVRVFKGLRMSHVPKERLNLSYSKMGYDGVPISKDISFMVTH